MGGCDTLIACRLTTRCGGGDRGIPLKKDQNTPLISFSELESARRRVHNGKPTTESA